MARSVTRLEGFKEFERAIVEELPKATARNLLVRIATKAMKPMEEAMARNAPYDPNDRDGDGRHLNETMRTQTVTAKLAKQVGGPTRNEGVAVMTGPAPTGKRARNNAGWQEHGTANMAANPYARPAADSEHGAVIEGVREGWRPEVEKVRARIAKKAAKGR